MIENILYTLGNQNEARQTILFSDKANFKSKLIKRSKEDYHISIDGTIQQEGNNYLYTCTEKQCF